MKINELKRRVQTGLRWLLPFSWRHQVWEIPSVPNDPRLELVFEWAAYLPPSDCKHLILQMRQPEIGFLTDEQAQIAINALGIGGA